MTRAFLPTPVVSPKWLAVHLGESDLVVVDASWYLAAMNRNALAEYSGGHIPGAIFWDLDALSDQRTALPHMLPAPGRLAEDIGRLGIGDRDQVVVYDGSGVNLSAPRVWWTLRVAGHERVAVLDGGLGRWRAEGRPVEQGSIQRPPARFTLRFRPALIRSMEQLRAAMERESLQVLDARSRGRFEGSEPEPRPGLRGGHIPGAKNLPYTELVGSDGQLLPLEELRRRFSQAAVDLSAPVVVSCGSGVTACALALGLEVLGHHGYAVYDGSWSEWGQEQGPPIERGSAGPG